MPLIIAGSSLTAQGSVTSAFSFVTDITPTLLSFAGVAQPGTRYRGRPVQPMIGRNLRPLLLGGTEHVYGPEDTVGYELAGHAALFRGEYKIVRNRGPVGDGQWRLFNITEDPGETSDLAAAEPARLQLMLSAYERYTQDNKVLPVPAGYNHVKQLVTNLMYDRLRTPILVGLLTVLILVPFLVAYRMRDK